MSISDFFNAVIRTVTQYFDPAAAELADAKVSFPVGIVGGLAWARFAIASRINKNLEPRFVLGIIPIP